MAGRNSSHFFIVWRDGVHMRETTAATGVVAVMFRCVPGNGYREKVYPCDGKVAVQVRQKVGNDAINIVAEITLGRNRGGW